MKALVVGNAKHEIDDIAAAQLYPFFQYRKQLQTKLGLTFKHIQAYMFADIAEACKNVDADILFIRPDWREDASEAEKALESVRKNNPNKKLIFLDPFDQTATRYFNVLPYVDCFLKYQRLKDVSQYRQKFIGGGMFTDYLAREWHYDLQGWNVGSEVPEGYEHRIATGWNFATAKRFQDALNPPLLSKLNPPTKKTIDVFCRLSFGLSGKLEWYGQYRLAGVKKLAALASEYKLAVDTSPEAAVLVSRKQYADEIKHSRIVFAPFGWGEATAREYEATCHNCLVIKPSIEHVDTQPNIFFPGETYVPINWDFSDLEEKFRYYLEHPEEATQIAANARRAYKAYFENEEFVKRIEQLIAE
jgi:hypothetical protein